MHVHPSSTALARHWWGTAGTKCWSQRENIGTNIHVAKISLQLFYNVDMVRSVIQLQTNRQRPWPLISELNLYNLTLFAIALKRRNIEASFLVCACTPTRDVWNTNFSHITNIFYVNFQGKMCVISHIWLLLPAVRS